MVINQLITNPFYQLLCFLLAAFQLSVHVFNGYIQLSIVLLHVGKFPILLLQSHLQFRYFNLESALHAVRLLLSLFQASLAIRLGIAQSVLSFPYPAI